MSVSDQNTRMVTALVRLHGALQAARLPLELPGAAAARDARRHLVEQLEDYAIPRETAIDAPLLVVVGGSTGAGKSTLVNSLVGARVTAPGLLRPTTRSAVLVHHPDEAHWFGQERLLPELVRVDHSTDDRHSLQLVASPNVPRGLAIVDAPDVDSVEERNRDLATQLLAAADLWLFVTSAARYSDQVPWSHLLSAAERSAAVAVVLDRTPADSVQTVAAHLARMLASRGLKDSPLFTVDEGPVSDDGLLPPEQVADIRGWLLSIAADPEARRLVVRQTLEGTVRTVARHAHAVADAIAEQVSAVEALRAAADTAYDDASAGLVAEAVDGTLLRGEVLARWQDLVGTGQLLGGLDHRVGRRRARVVDAVKGTPQAADLVALAIEAGVEALVLDHAEAAADQVTLAWSQTPEGAALVAGEVGLRRAAPEVRQRAETVVRAWQEAVLDLVRAAVAEWRLNVDLLAHGAQGLGVAVMVQVVSSSAEDGADAVAAARPGRALLEAIIGQESTDRLVGQAAADLHQRLSGMLDADRARFSAAIDALGLEPDAAEQVRAAARRVDDRRFEQSRDPGGTAWPDTDD